MFGGFKEKPYLRTRLKIETDKSHTTSSLGIPQDGNIARVLGCSGAI